MAGPLQLSSTSAAFLGGVRAALTSVYMLVSGRHLCRCRGARANFGFSATWIALSTILIWAAPAQVILITSVGVGAPLAEAGDRRHAEQHPALSDGGRAVAAVARGGANKQELSQ